MWHYNNMLVLWCDCFFDINYMISTVLYTVVHLTSNIYRALSRRQTIYLEVNGWVLVTNCEIVCFRFVIFAEALRLHASRLTDYERQEIDKYPEIWFLGLDACKINAKPGTALNSGYDDDNGSYNKVCINLKRDFWGRILIWRVFFFHFRLFTIISHTDMRYLKWSAKAVLVK